MDKLAKQALRQNSRFRGQDSGLPDFQQGLALHMQGDLGGASKIYGAIIESDPENFDALHLLGVAAHQSGHSADAVQLINRALEIQPSSSDAYSNKSAALMDLGLFEEALTSCQAAIQLNSESPEAWYNAGNACSKLGRHHEAISNFIQAIQLKPDYIVAITNLGGELIDVGENAQAIEMLGHALELDPSCARAWLNLGAAWQESGDISKAESCFSNAVELMPNYGKGWINLSNIAYSKGNLMDSANLVNEALNFVPEQDAAIALGNCYRALGQPERACEALRQANFECEAGSVAQSNYLLTRLSCPNVTRSDCYEDATHWAALHAPWKPQPPARPHELKRIGFISPDLRIHPVGFFLESLLTQIQGVEVFLYANQTEFDAQSERLQSLATQWRQTKTLQTEQFCELIQSDEIDVLIDLAGHTANGRLDVFAKWAAPVQLTWLGYSGTTGMSQFDAIIGDSTVTPWGHEAEFSEPIERLPDSFVCHFLSEDLPDVPERNAKSPVTFGSFNATSKFNDEVIMAWAQILHSVPQSQLVIKNLYCADPLLQDRVLQTFAGQGIEEHRIEFIGSLSREDHFEAFSRIDIALDTFPYSGATTTVENLWMGVPVVTLAGDRYAARMSASILKCIGHPEWVAEDLESYVQIATQLASDVESLANIRMSLRTEMQASPLTNSQKFCEDFLALIVKIWKQRQKQAA